MNSFALIKMNKLLLLLPLLFAVGIGTAYAAPLENIDTEIIELDNDVATVQISWNQDDSVSQYEVGCVSCSPNITETTSENSIILKNVTSIGEKPLALLYVIAYDPNSEIVNAEQIFVELN